MNKFEVGDTVYNFALKKRGFVTKIMTRTHVYLKGVYEYLYKFSPSNTKDLPIIINRRDKKFNLPIDEVNFKHVRALLTEKYQ